MRAKVTISQSPRLSIPVVLAGLGLAVTVLLGSILTAQAVTAGDPVETFVRFVGATGLGGYYLYLLQLARGRRYFS